MVYRVWDDMSQCTSEDVDRLLGIVPDKRRAYALRYRHVFGQWTALRAWVMVSELAGRVDDWQEAQWGKPYWSGGPEFSISHCKHGIAVIVDRQPVGIDIESIRVAEPSLVRRTMNAEEQALIFSSDCPDLAFTRLWTRKEAVLKYRGTGIVDDLHQVLDNTNNLVINTMDHVDKGYVVTCVYTHENN